MKIKIPCAIVIITLAFTAGCSFLSKHHTQTSNAAQAAPQPTPEPIPPVINELENLFFADQSLEEFAANFKPEGAAAKDDFSHWFALALASSRKGDTAQARKHLKRILEIPDVEARVRLWAWKALRQFGEHPPSNISREVHGVVIEIPVESGLDTLAVYSDGTLRYINYSGKILIWDKPDNRFSALIKNLITSAEPLIIKASALEKHKEVKPGFAQVSVLTFGGIYQVEEKESQINEKSAIYPAIMAGSQLLPGLTEVAEQKDSK